MSYREERDGLRFRRDRLFDRLTALETSDDDDSRRALLRELDDVALRLTALAPKHLPLLSSVRIAAACPANWSSMVGTDRVRHCGICDKQVWNLTALDPEEAEAFLASQIAAKPCIRVHRRRDGLFQDGSCEPGVRRLERAAALALVLGLVAAASLVSVTSERAVRPRLAHAPNAPVSTVDEALFFAPTHERPALDPRDLSLIGHGGPSGALADVLRGGGPFGEDAWRNGPPPPQTERGRATLAEPEPTRSRATR